MCFYRVCTSVNRVSYWAHVAVGSCDPACRIGRLAFSRKAVCAGGVAIVSWTVPGVVASPPSRVGQRLGCWSCSGDGVVSGWDAEALFVRKHVPAAANKKSAPASHKEAEEDDSGDADEQDDERVEDTTIRIAESQADRFKVGADTFEGYVSEGFWRLRRDARFFAADRSSSFPRAVAGGEAVIFIGHLEHGCLSFWILKSLRRQARFLRLQAPVTRMAQM